MSRFKYFLFRYYGWISVLLIAGVLGFAWSVGPPRDWQLTLTSITAVVSFAYFVQKQKLEETRLINDFFTTFNARYDRMNDELGELVGVERSRTLTREERKLLVDYFNLCGEEYLVWKQGYVYPEVWRSWINGMSYYMADRRISEFWHEERSTQSYYGLEDLLK